MPARIWLLAYSFDRQEIVDGLLGCHQAGHQIKFGVDHGMTTSGRTRDQMACLKRLIGGGISTVLIRGQALAPIYASEGREMSGGWQGIQHSKAFYAEVPFKGTVYRLLIIGSANWTLSSQCNCEMTMFLNVTNNQKLAEDVKAMMEGFMSRGQTMDTSKAAAIARARSASPGPTQRRFVKAAKAKSEEPEEQ